MLRAGLRKVRHEALLEALLFAVVRCRGAGQPPSHLQANGKPKHGLAHLPRALHR